MQRVTGQGEEAWPDARPAPTRRRPIGARPRWPFVLLGLATALAVLGGGWLIWSRPGAPRPCRYFVGSFTDYTWTTGPGSPDDAIRTYLQQPHLYHLPRSGYVAATADEARRLQHQGLYDATYVHHANGRVDAALFLEHQGTIWQVSEAEQVNGC